MISGFDSSRCLHELRDLNRLIDENSVQVRLYAALDVSDLRGDCLIVGRGSHFRLALCAELTCLLIMADAKRPRSHPIPSAIKALVYGWVSIVWRSAFSKLLAPAAAIFDSFSEQLGGCRVYTDAATAVYMQAPPSGPVFYLLGRSICQTACRR